MTITLPLGLRREDEVYRTAEVGMLDGHTLKALRQALGNRTTPKNLDAYKTTLKAGLKGIEGLKEPLGSVLEGLFYVDAEYIYHTMALMELEVLGEGAKLRRLCQRCNTIQEFEVALENRECVMLEDISPKFNEDLLVPFKLKTPVTTLDDSGAPYDEGMLGLHTFGDFLAIGQRALKNSGAAMAYAATRFIYQLGPCGKGEVDERDLGCLPAVEIKRLEKLYNEVEPGLESLGSFECPSCGGEVKIDTVDYVSDFFIRAS